MNRTARGCDPDDFIAHFRDWALDDEARYYLQFHARRYAFLLDVLRGCVSTSRDAGLPGGRILDVGPSAFTQFMRDKDVGSPVDSLGFQDHRFTCRAGDTHIEYDLTQAVDRLSWPSVTPYDVVVMAEVIEHLPISPTHVLAFIGSLLKPGGFLILQTPNACSLPKRLRMLRGQNPYEMIREGRQNPGHFREYTLRELTELARACGFRVCSVTTANYFLRPTWTSRLFRRLERLFPAGLRDGITLSLMKQR